MTYQVSVPLLSSSDNKLLNDIISQDEAKKHTVDEIMKTCGIKFHGLADQLMEVAKTHPDAVAEFLAQQGELRMYIKDHGRVTADDVKHFFPSGYEEGKPRGIDAVARHLEEIRTKSCSDDLIRQSFPPASSDTAKTPDR